MGYENWQARPGFRLAPEPATTGLPKADRPPSLRRRLALVMGLGIASWVVLIGGMRAAVWAFQALGTGG